MIFPQSSSKNMHIYVFYSTHIKFLDFEIGSTTLSLFWVFYRLVTQAPSVKQAGLRFDIRICVDHHSCICAYAHRNCTENGVYLKGWASLNVSWYAQKQADLHRMIYFIICTCPKAALRASPQRYTSPICLSIRIMEVLHDGPRPIVLPRSYAIPLSPG